MDIASAALPTSRRFITQLLDSLSIEQGAADTANANATTNPLTNISDATRKQLLALQVLFPNEFVPALDLLDRRLVTRFRIRNGEEKLAARVTGTEQGDGEDVQMQDTGTLNETERKHAGPPSRTDMSTVSDCTDRDAVKETTNLSSSTTAQAPKSFASKINTIYYVRSAQHRPTRYSTSYDTLTTYQVRLWSWNCSCPAFAFTAFPACIPHSHSYSPAPIPLAHPPPHHHHTYHPTLSHHPTHPPKPNQQEDDKETNETFFFGGTTLGSATPPVCKHLLACVLAERCKRLFDGFVDERGVGVEEAAGWAAGWGD